MPAIYLIRHGQASFGAEDYDQLSPLGEQQSRMLGDWLQRCGQRPARVVAGSLKRHRQTAEACLESLPGGYAGEWQIGQGFDEFDHHEVLVRYRPEFDERAVLGQFLADSGNPRQAFQQVFTAAVARWVGGEHDDYSESWVGFKARCNAALAELTVQAAEGATWVFTSGGPISVIVQQLLAIPDRKIFDLNWTLANTGVTRLMYRPGQVSVGTVNAFPHLEAAGDPQLITYR